MARVTARKLNILVVDDDTDIVRFVRSVLLQHFSEVAELTVLTDPSIAMEFIARQRCDVLVSDIEMPGLDGMTLVKAAKARNPWTQVVFITGHSSLDRISKAVELGASDYLLKPLDRTALIEVVGQLCRRCDRWQSAVLETFESTNA